MQNVSLSNVFSEDEIITDGVPQGSILGPLPFLMFINDLPCILILLILIFMRMAQHFML